MGVQLVLRYGNSAIVGAGEMKRRVLTVGGVARAAGVSEWTVREYAKRNLIPHWVDSAGRRLFDENAIQAVRAVYARRPASRGETGR